MQRALSLDTKSKIQHTGNPTTHQPALRRRQTDHKCRVELLLFQQRDRHLQLASTAQTNSRRQHAGLRLRGDVGMGPGSLALQKHQGSGLPRGITKQGEKATIAKSVGMEFGILGLGLGRGHTWIGCPPCCRSRITAPGTAWSRADFAVSNSCFPPSQFCEYSIRKAAEGGSAGEVPAAILVNPAPGVLRFPKTPGAKRTPGSWKAVACGRAMSRIASTTLRRSIV